MTQAQFAIALECLHEGQLINSRRTAAEQADDAALKSSLRAKGVLSPLRVRPVADRDGHYEIINGNRRYRLLLELEQEGATIDPLPCLIGNEASDGEAHENSVIINQVAAPLHPVDQYRAYARMRRDGREIAHIAAAFGQSEPLVRQRLSLGALPDGVLAALTTDEITLDVAKAFTLCTDDGQALVLLDLYRAAPDWQRNARWLRARITEGRDVASRGMAAFVGRDDYVKAGGKVTDDLFSDCAIFDDAALLEKLGRKKLAKEAKRLVKDEGWGWAQFAADLPDDHHDWPEAEENVGEEEIPVDDNGEYRFCDAFTPERRALCGVVLSIDEDGDLRRVHGVVKPDDVAKLWPEEAEGEDAIVSETVIEGETIVTRANGEVTATPAEPDGEDGPLTPISNALADELSKVRTTALADALEAKPVLGVALLAASLWLPLSGRHRSGSPLRISVTESRAGRDLSGWVDKVPGDLDGAIAAVMAMATGERTRFLAALAAAVLDATVNAAPYHQPDREAVAALESRAGMDAANHRPDAENYFKRLPSKRHIRAAIADMKGEAFATALRPDASKAELADVAERIAADNRWLPAELRGPGYDFIAPLPPSPVSEPVDAGEAPCDETAPEALGETMEAQEPDAPHLAA